MLNRASRYASCKMRCSHAVQNSQTMKGIIHLQGHAKPYIALIGYLPTTIVLSLVLCKGSSCQTSVARSAWSYTCACPVLGMGKLKDQRESPAVWICFGYERCFCFRRPGVCPEAGNIDRNDDAQGVEASFVS